ncbi:hypothetical protein LTR27_010667 [Elasticomyces elasticus]|nr:hypothetical protein LTR27_010667 [Elasticomyces elasticus]
MKRSVSKRPLTEVDPNIEREGAATKRLKAVLERKREEKNTLARDAMEPDAYLCINRPYWDFHGEHIVRDDVFESDEYPPDVVRRLWQDDEDSSRRAGKPATDFPEWKWAMMKDADIKLDILRRKAEYCDPNNFPSMHFYSHYHNYGVSELLDGQLALFYEPYLTKGLVKMWCIVLAVGHWLNCSSSPFGEPVIMTLVGTDDFDSLCARIRTAGCMFLTTLAAIDAAGQLKASSRFRDLGLVMSLWLEWSGKLEDYGIGEEGECEWRKHLVSYAKKSKIDLFKVGAGVHCKVALHKFKKVKTLTRKDAKITKWDWTGAVSRIAYHYDDSAAILTSRRSGGR